MDARYEHFLHDMLDVCSKYFKQLHSMCEKHKNPSARHDDSDDQKKPKKTKKKVNDPLKDDPNAPKKPIIQGYLLFYTEVRSQKQKENPKLPNTELTKLIADDWKNLSKEKRGDYEIRARVNKQQYEKDLESYLDKNPKMRDLIEKAKNANKKPGASTEGSVVNEPTKKKSQKVLADSSEEESDEDDVKIKNVNSQKPKASSSSDESDSDSDDDSDSDSEDEKPKKKVKK